MRAQAASPSAERGDVIRVSGPSDRDGILRCMFILTAPHRPGKQYHCVQDLFQLLQLHCEGLPGLSLCSPTPQAVQPVHNGHRGVTTEVSSAYEFQGEPVL